VRTCHLSSYGNSGNDDIISQSFATVPGTTYILNFQLSIYNDDANLNDFLPSVGESVLTQIYPSPSLLPIPCVGCVGTYPNYEFYSLSFVAEATNTTLSFAAQNSGSGSYTCLTGISVCEFSSSVPYV
jgi:hypothetical protein